MFLGLLSDISGFRISVLELYYKCAVYIYVIHVTLILKTRTVICRAANYGTSSSFQVNGPVNYTQTHDIS